MQRKRLAVLGAADSAWSRVIVSFSFKGAALGAGHVEVKGS
jgi:hypothetical protein